MDSFAGKIAVVTGGGTGMGRELVVQLAGTGCHVATCDVNERTLAETAELAAAASDVRVTTHHCDVSEESDVLRFRDEVVEQQETDHVNLVFNNAGIGGGGSFVTGDQAEWERTFGVSWFGVYHCSRAFVPLLVASAEGYLVNTSSVNGFWANLGKDRPHTAYSAAKFAIKGFSEALITDFAVHAPHVKVAVVMPGHIGTEIVSNTLRVLYGDQMPQEVQEQVAQFGSAFRDNARTSAAEAATIILDGVRGGRWRILIGDDAVRADETMRHDPEAAYGPDGVDLPTLLRSDLGGVATPSQG